MARVTTISLDNRPSQVECDCGDLDLTLHDRVVAQAEHGLVVGKVIVAPRPERGERPNARVVRRMTAADEASVAELKILDAKAFLYAKRRIAEREMAMRLLSVHHRFDAKQAIFFFSAERRVDFRDLVRELAYQFRIRVEMRQVTQREAPQLLDGLGPCGRRLCCSGYIHQFQPVSVRMAKVQGISLNPTKLSGCCGKLKCCLRYEQDGYEAFHKGLPKRGTQVTVDGMKSTVLTHQYVRRITLVARSDGERVTVPTGALRPGATEPARSDSPPTPSHPPALAPSKEARPKAKPRPRPKPESKPEGQAAGTPPATARTEPEGAAAPKRKRRRRRRGRGHERGNQGGGGQHGGQSRGGQGGGGQS